MRMQSEPFSVSTIVESGLRQARTPLLVGTCLAALVMAGCAASQPQAAGNGPNAVQSMIAASTTDATGVSATHGDDGTPPVSSSNKKKGLMSSRMAKSFDDAVRRGDASWRDGDADMAIYFYVQALSFQDRDFDTLCKIGAIEQKRDKLDLAARAFEVAATVKPDDTRVTGRLGLLYVETGDEDKAATWLARSADSGSDNWRVYDNLGVIEGHRKAAPLALQHLQRAIELAPVEAGPMLHKGQVQFESGDYQGAELSLRGATSKGDVPEAQNLLGQILAKRRAYPEAIDSLLRVLDAPKAYNLLGQEAMANGDNAIALHYFEQAATLSPTYYADAHRSAALARERLDTAR